MTFEGVKEQLLQLFIDNGISEEGFHDDIPIGENGIVMDSILFMEVFVEIENLFHVPINHLALFKNQPCTLRMLIEHIIAQSLKRKESHWRGPTV
jgi:acyl carrier protein